MGALAAVALCPLAASAADDPDPEARYQAMLAAAKANPAATDWQALRFAFAERPANSPLIARAGLTAITAAEKASDWPALLDAAEKYLDVNWVDGRAHRAAGMAYAEMGRIKDSFREVDISGAIFESMVADGNGLSQEHAIAVISVVEEYELLAAMNWHRSGSQALLQSNDHFYDTIEAEDGNGRKATFWFQIDRVIAAEARVLSPDGAAPRQPGSPDPAHPQ